MRSRIDGTTTWDELMYKEQKDIVFAQSANDEQKSQAAASNPPTANVIESPLFIVLKLFNGWFGGK